MNILNQIIQNKRIEVSHRRRVCTFEKLQDQIPEVRPYSLTQYLMNASKNGMIAEFKRQSPSKGVINNTARVLDVVKGYQRAGVSAVSILTDTMYFGGGLLDLQAVSKVLGIPILRKDFMVDEYQILESRVYGASAILLIASVLSPQEIERFTAYAHQLNMEVLFEVHTEEELQKACDGIDVYGINNRDLKTFSVNIEQSIALFDELPANKPAVAESGIDAVETVLKLKQVGFEGFLMGEIFMKTSDPAQACMDFAKQLQEGKS